MLFAAQANKRKGWKAKDFPLVCHVTSTHSLSHKHLAFIIGSRSIYDSTSLLGWMKTLVQHNQSRDKRQHDHAQDTSDRGNNGQRTSRFLSCEVNETKHVRNLLFIARFWFVGEKKKQAYDRVKTIYLPTITLTHADDLTRYLLSMHIIATHSRNHKSHVRAICKAHAHIRTWTHAYARTRTLTLFLWLNIFSGQWSDANGLLSNAIQFQATPLPGVVPFASLGTTWLVVSLTAGLHSAVKVNSGPWALP